MNSKIKKRVAMISVIALVIAIFPIQASAVAGTIYESESNNTYLTADVTYDDYNNYGTISSANDVDWWEITMDSDGLGAIWLGNIPDGCDYDIYAYNVNGDELLASSKRALDDQEYIRIRYYAGVTIYLKVVSYSGFSSTAQYLLRFKNYDLGKARTFSFVFDDLNTYNVQTSYTTLSNYGFTSLYYVNNLATSVATVFTNSQIMIISSHGSPGKIYCDEGTAIYAFDHEDCVVGDFAMSTLADRSMTEMELIFFDGCSTSDGRSEYGDLLQTAVSKGAEVALGWSNTVYSPEAELFVNELIANLNVRSVEGAIDVTKQWAREMRTDNYDDLVTYLEYDGRPEAVNLV